MKMNSCIECGNVIKVDSSYYSCDKCKGDVCGSCADLTETEVLCLELEVTRRLKFFCKNCDETLNIQPETESSVVCIKGVVHNIIEELSMMNNSLEKRILTVLINLEDKMKSMKDSNIDLIKLISDSARKPSVQNSKPIKLSFNQFTGKQSLTVTQNKMIKDCYQTVNDSAESLRKADRKQKNIGSAKVNSEDHFVAAEKKLWIYVWRVNRKVSEQDVMNYLQNKPECEEENFIVKELPTNETQNKCFMVGASLKLKTAIYDNGFWPSRVGYKRFDFRKYRAYNRASTLIFKRSIKRE